MRLRIKAFFLTSAYGLLEPGQVVEAPKDLASTWIRKGLAMEDKSLDGAKEVKRG